MRACMCAYMHTVAVNKRNEFSTGQRFSHIHVCIIYIINEALLAELALIFFFIFFFIRPVLKKKNNNITCNNLGYPINNILKKPFF